MIRLDGLTKRFGSLVAVDALTLDIPAGQLFAFLGPNAAGKTTTIKMMAGLLKPTAGRVRIGTHDVHQSPVEAKRLLAYIPDCPFLYDKLTANEMLMVVGELFGMASPELERQRDHWFEYFDLNDYRHELLENLSHGTRQRVVFATAFVHSPRVIVVDEPMVGLDPRHGRLVKDALRNFAGRGGTVFLSTHVLSVAEELADRIGIINHGRLAACGSLAELRKLGKDEELEKAFLAITEEPASAVAAGKAPI
ncbi:MAG: ABC transporter ATP-binding protein [Verrucomicrobiae bacterium]|nr:ABC transporter ATP-binding protein [Verrucomicrobiae bacterium]